MAHTRIHSAPARHHWRKHRGMARHESMAPQDYAQEVPIRTPTNPPPPIVRRPIFPRATLNG